MQVRKLGVVNAMQEIILQETVTQYLDRAFSEEMNIFINCAVSQKRTMFPQINYQVKCYPVSGKNKVQCQLMPWSLVASHQSRGRPQSYLQLTILPFLENSRAKVKSCAL